jgi:hypothetical protein
MKPEELSSLFSPRSRAIACSCGDKF